MNDSMINHLDKHNKKINCLIQSRKYNNDQIEHFELEKYHCTIASIKEGLNISQPLGELILPLLFPFAKFQRQTNLEWCGSNADSADFNMVEISIEVSATDTEESKE